MENYTITEQGMLLILQRLYRMLQLKPERRRKASDIQKELGLEPKYWRKLFDGGIIENIGPSCNKPIYVWSSPKEPNIYTAKETLKDYPEYDKISTVPQYAIDLAQHPYFKGNIRKDCDNESVKNTNEAKPLNIPFSEFWDLYDKKVGKVKSELKWGKLTNKEREAIMKKLPEYKEARPDPMYRKDPITFLNNKSWLDELPKPGYYKHPEQNTNPCFNCTAQKCWDNIKRQGYKISDGKLVKELE